MSVKKADNRQAIGSGALGFPASLVLVWILGMFDVETPAEVAAAIGALLSGVLGFLFVKTKQEKAS